MANQTPTARKFTISAADAFYLGDASDGRVGTHAVMLVSSSFSGSVTVKARIRGSDAATDAVTPVAVPYLARYLNGAVGSDSIVTTAITGTSLILVPSSGQVPVLDCTSYTSGTLTAYVFPLEGAAA